MTRTRRFPSARTRMGPAIGSIGIGFAIPAGTAITIANQILAR